MTATIDVGGRVLAGRYELGDLISEGGMGKVYEGVQLLLGRKVAIKLLNADDSDGLSVERFEREAAVLAKLDHRNLVTIHDYGRDGADFFIVMEYVEGITLGEMLREHGAPEYTDIVHIAREVARGLRAAHRQGVIHRDLKPDNILIRTDTSAEDRECVKILDFGIAKLLEHPLTGEESTLFGSPRFMSPEQICGENVGPESDIYALGVVLYTMITGVQPFDAPTYGEVLQQHVSERPPPMASMGFGRKCPRSLERLVQRCLEKFPSHRFSSISTLLPHLEALYADLPNAERTPLPRSNSGPNVPAKMPPPPLAPRTLDVHPMTSDFPAYSESIFDNARLGWILAFVFCLMSVAWGVGYLLG